MMRRISGCFWSENGSEAESIAKHNVTVEEVEEIVLGIDDEEPNFKLRRDGDLYALLGETGDGRLLKLVGALLPDNTIRVFHAMDMTAGEKALFRKGK